MDIGNLFGNTDNLFKFLFSGGILLIVLSIIYPLQQKQEVELEINNHNKEVALQNSDINCLMKEVTELSKKKDRCFTRLDSLKEIRNKNNYKIITQQIVEVKKDFNLQFLQLEDRESQLTTKSIINKYNKKRIKILKEHLALYKKYASWLLTVGVILSFVGLIFWIKSTHRSEKLKKKELEG